MVDVKGTRKWAELTGKVVPDGRVIMKLEQGDHSDKSFKVATNMEGGSDSLEPAWLV